MRIIQNESDPKLPFTIQSAEQLNSWFQKNARPLPFRKDRDPYRIWLSEVMLQQTRMNVAVGYYEKFLSVCPDIRSLYELDMETLYKLWEGLGYYSRARNLINAAGVIIEKHSGIFPDEYPDIRSLPGVGDYTAGAISSICYGLPEPAVDGNVLRVFARLSAAKTVDKVLKTTVQTHLKNVYHLLQPEDRGTLTQALMELGETVCLPNTEPACGGCPIKSVCEGYQSGRAAAYPAPKEKKEKRVENLTVLILCFQGKTALQKREGKGLLSGLWELPHISGTAAGREEIGEWAEQKGLKIHDFQAGRSAVHVFTHIVWKMESYLVAVDRMADGFEWADEKQLSAAYALPRAFSKLLF